MTNLTVAVDIGNNTKDVLQQLAEKLGTTADKAWPILVKQQIIESCCITGGSLLVCLGLFLLFKKAKEVEEKKEYCEDKVFTWFSGGFLLVAVFVTLITSLILVNTLFNPEYFAMKEAISLLKGMKP
jgi:hypothetical protein